MRKPGGYTLTIFMLLLCIAAITPNACHAQDMFPVGDIATFDGKSWGGLNLGQSSTAEIKKAFKTSKGAIRPEAMLLPQPASSTVRVDVLTNGRGETSLLSGFRIAYSDAGPDIKALAAALKLEPEIWYPQERYDDWYAAAFPERGIVVFVEGSGRTERASLVLLCSPFHVRDVVSDCVKQPTPPLDIRDTFPDSKRVVEIGLVNVFVNASKGIKIDRSDDVARELEQRIRRMRTPREIDVHTGAKGVWNVHLDLSYSSKDKRSTLDATSDMSGTTILGRVSAASRVSDTFREDSDNPIWIGSSRLERTMYDALDRVMDQMADHVRKQPLPTPAALRLRACDAMIDRATK